MRLTPTRAAAAAVLLVIAVAVAAVLEAWAVALVALALLNAGVLLAVVTGPGPQRTTDDVLGQRLAELGTRVEALTARVVAGTADTRGELLELRREIALDRPAPEGGHSESGT